MEKRNYHLEQQILTFIRSKPKSRVTDIVSNLTDNPTAIISSIGYLVNDDKIISTKINSIEFGFNAR